MCVSHTSLITDTSKFAKLNSDNRFRLDFGLARNRNVRSIEKTPPSSKFRSWFWQMRPEKPAYLSIIQDSGSDQQLFFTLLWILRRYNDVNNRFGLALLALIRNRNFGFAIYREYSWTFRFSVSYRKETTKKAKTKQNDRENKTHKKKKNSPSVPRY